MTNEVYQHNASMIQFKVVPRRGHIGIRRRSINDKKKFFFQIVPSITYIFFNNASLIASFVLIESIAIYLHISTEKYLNRPVSKKKLSFWSLRKEPNSTNLNRSIIVLLWWCWTHVGLNQRGSQCTLRPLLAKISIAVHWAIFIADWPVSSLPCLPGGAGAHVNIAGDRFLSRFTTISDRLTLNGKSIATVRHRRFNDGLN